MYRLESLLSLLFLILLGGGVALGTLLTLFASPAGAQTNCAPRPVVIERLADRYGESRRSIGLGANNAVVEVFASDETGTWSITVTSPNGLTCLVASGQAYEAFQEHPAKSGEQL